MLLQVVVVLVIIVLIAALSKTVSASTVDPIQKDSLKAKAKQYASKYGVDPYLVMAIIQKESSFVVRAYNSEGHAPPINKPKLGKVIPIGFDIDGYQGSFGLGQINHTSGWSTAEAMRGGGLYPEDLLDPDVNIDITSKFIKYFLDRGFSIDTIDVYNIGETGYAKGVRNPSYVQVVKSNYSLFREGKL